MASRHAVSAGHYLAAEAANSVLDGGGNAVDAGVAAGIALGVVQSDLVNFAGVAPIMIWLAERHELVCIDGLGSWPAATDVDWLAREHPTQMPMGVRRTVIPAAPAAWLHALTHYGTASFTDVASRAIEHARDGFAIDPFMCEFIAANEAGFARWESNREIYLPVKRLPVPGQRFVQSDLAASLQYMCDEERAAAGGGRTAGLQAARDAFYRGDIGARIVAHQREQDGWLSEADLAHYQVREEATVPVRFRGLDVHACGPWSQGPALAETLALLEGLPLESQAPGSAQQLHLLASCLDLAFANREAHYRDPAFDTVPLQALLDEATIAARRGLIDAARAFPGLPPPTQLASETHDGPTSRAAPNASGAARELPRDTSYVCVFDREGNAFSATPSDVACDSPVVPGTGLCPSSRGSQSRPWRGHPASVAPGRRPRLTPNPAIALRDGEAVLAFGTPGGDVQVQAMVQFLVNRCVHGLNVQAAIEAARVVTFNAPSSFSPFGAQPGVLGAEQRLGDDVMDELEALGYRLERWPSFTRMAGALCAIEREPASGLLHAGADPRRAAYAIGH